MQQEKQHVELKRGIETFSADQLKHTDTEEKNFMPTKEGSYLSSYIPLAIAELLHIHHSLGLRLS